MIKIECDQPLKDFSTFQIGGPAKFFARVHSANEMKEAFAFCNSEKTPFFILGKGSNCLFDDRGFNGCIILNLIDHCHFNDDNTVKAGSGYSFSRLGIKTARKRLSGLEFACGIPGTVGGAVYMNAGANHHQTEENLLEVTYLNDDGTFKLYSRDELFFSYRYSPFHSKKGAILDARFQLRQKEEAKDKQAAIFRYRKETQPLDMPSAGCVFRNPDQSHSGALIEACGLKGMQIGGAQVSLTHANFIVNSGNATCAEVLQLIASIQKEVEYQTGHHLQMEIKYIPYV